MNDFGIKNPDEIEDVEIEQTSKEEGASVIAIGAALTLAAAIF